MKIRNGKNTLKVIVLFICIINLSCCRNIDETQVLNPYAKVNWNEVNYFCSTTHMHLKSKKDFDSAYEGGIRHFAISNYYPSAPYTPLKDIKENQFRVSQKHGIIKDGVFTEGPFYWNEILMDEKNGWINELGEDQKEQLPFKIGQPLVSHIPDDIIESPNAEHHFLSNSSLHFNSLGSYYASGTFDKRSKFKLNDNGYKNGSNITWQEAFEKALKELKFKSGGGITINHPVYSNLDTAEIIKMLDFDERVLGIEIYNPSAEYDKRESFSIKEWDAILSTGRRCWGFCVPDHTHRNREWRSTERWQGKMFLLIDELTEQDCLEAYRNGCFYGAIKGNGFAFNKIELDGSSVAVEVNKQATITFISDKGKERIEGSSATYKLPVKEGKCELVYLRIEAKDNEGETLFSQPIMF